MILMNAGEIFIILKNPKRDITGHATQWFGLESDSRQLKEILF
jgi:hypothetical protein